MERTVRYTGLLVMMLINVLVVKGLCPQNGQQGAQIAARCVAPVAKIFDLSKGAASSDELQIFCKPGGSASGAVDCLRKIFDDCARENPTVRRILAKAFDLNAYEKALKYVCDNRNVLVTSQTCVSRQSTSLGTCVLAAQRNFKNKYQSLLREANTQGVKWFEDAAIKALCSLNDGMSDCVGPIRIECGEEIGDIYLTMVSSTRSPGCAKYDPSSGFPKGNGGNTAVPGSNGLLISIVFILLNLVKASNWF